MSDSPANADMIEYWDGDRGASWVQHADQFDRQLELYGLRAISAIAPQPAESVLDIGCGSGATTFEVSQAVGSAGRVVGVDISGPMLALAGQRAEADGYGHVQFVQADAQTAAPIGAPFDAAVSRFGVMFFDDPVAAFRNIASMVRPGGRIAFAAWGAFEANEWMWAPAVALAEIVPLPPPADPNAPGPFAFRDPERVRSILADAGWEDITVEDVDDPIYVGGPGSVEDAVDFVVASSALATDLLQRDAEVQAEARRRLVELFTPQHDLVGVNYPALARVFRAVKPA